MNRLTQYIELTLGQESKFALPGFGTFRIDRLPAHLDRSKGLIYPPRKQVRFNVGNAADDGILRRLYMSREGSPEEQSLVAAELLRADVEALRQLLETGTPVAIGHVGILVKDPWQNSKIVFRSEGSTQGLDLPPATLMTREEGKVIPDEPAEPVPEAKSLIEEDIVPPAAPEQPEESLIADHSEPTDEPESSPQPEMAKADEPTEPADDPVLTEGTPPGEEPAPESPVGEKERSPLTTVPEPKLPEEKPKKKNRAATYFIVIGILLCLTALIVYLVISRGETKKSESPVPPTEKIDQTPAPPVVEEPVPEPESARETKFGLPVYHQSETTPMHYIIIASLVSDKEVENFTKNHDLKTTFPEAGLLLMRNGQLRIFAYAIEDSDEALKKLREVRRQDDFSQSWSYLDK